MSGPKVLVLGATGPAGICLLRELLSRNHATVVYARNPTKIPEDILSNPLLETVKGEMEDHDALSSAMAKCTIILSLLGPDIKDKDIKPSMYADIYKSSVFPLMRQHGIKRIFASSTITTQRPEDHWTLIQTVIVWFVWLFANPVYRNVINLAKVFDNDASDLEWTVFRVAQIPGESDETSWKVDREEGEVFSGWVGEKWWTSSVKRSALARWIVDQVESEENKWVRKMPAVALLSGSEKKSV
ncbi:hypothetical protein jhhlp_001865 [Lomentospora prolificans]|uniref:NAD(P)-binding domain-containing protein n=1 Tax=Lomentospora prolificans TaxID=41688 RepID=A0A2N3NCE2_9PEZI|nr:hypothetical protein jhhlp_001865 [Lomentospora prolificans]